MPSRCAINVLLFMIAVEKATGLPTPGRIKALPNDRSNGTRKVAMTLSMGWYGIFNVELLRSLSTSLKRARREQIGLGVKTRIPWIMIWIF